MNVYKKTGAAIFIVLVMVAIGSLYNNTNRTSESQSDGYALNDDIKQPTALRVTTLQGEDLTKIDAWLAQQNETGLKSASIP